MSTLNFHDLPADREVAPAEQQLIATTTAVYFKDGSPPIVWYEYPKGFLCYFHPETKDWRNVTVPGVNPPRGYIAEAFPRYFCSSDMQLSTMSFQNIIDFSIFMKDQMHPCAVISAPCFMPYREVPQDLPSRDSVPPGWTWQEGKVPSDFSRTGPQFPKR